LITLNWYDLAHFCMVDFQCSFYWYLLVYESLFDLWQKEGEDLSIISFCIFIGGFID